MNFGKLQNLLHFVSLTVALVLLQTSLVWNQLHFSFCCLLALAEELWLVAPRFLLLGLVSLSGVSATTEGNQIVSCNSSPFVLILSPSAARQAPTGEYPA